MPDRPPLPDADHTAAVEAGGRALAQQATRAHSDRDRLAALVVDAVWPILHPAAYAAGRASVLDGATEEWGVGLPDEFLEAPYVDEAHARRRAGSIAPVVHRHVTPWESVDEVKP